MEAVSKYGQLQAATVTAAWRWAGRGQRSETSIMLHHTLGVLHSRHCPKGPHLLCQARLGDDCVGSRKPALCDFGDAGAGYVTFDACGAGNSGLFLM